MKKNLRVSFRNPFATFYQLFIEAILLLLILIIGAAINETSYNDPMKMIERTQIKRAL